MKSNRSEVSSAIHRLDARFLTASVALQAALMPVVHYGGIASRIGSPSLLAATYAFEAACFLCIAFMRGVGRDRILRCWMSLKPTSAMSGVLCVLLIEAPGIYEEKDQEANRVPLG